MVLSNSPKNSGTAQIMLGQRGKTLKKVGNFEVTAEQGAALNDYLYAGRLYKGVEPGLMEAAEDKLAANLMTAENLMFILRVADRAGDDAALISKIKYKLKKSPSEILKIVHEIADTYTDRKERKALYEEYPDVFDEQNLNVERYLCFASQPQNNALTLTAMMVDGITPTIKVTGIEKAKAQAMFRAFVYTIAHLVVKDKLVEAFRTDTLAEITPEDKTKINQHYRQLVATIKNHRKFEAATYGWDENELPSAEDMKLVAPDPDQMLIRIQAHLGVAAEVARQGYFIPSAEFLVKHREDIFAASPSLSKTISDAAYAGMSAKPPADPFASQERMLGILATARMAAQQKNTARIDMIALLDMDRHRLREMKTVGPDIFKEHLEKVLARPDLINALTEDFVSHIDEATWTRLGLLIFNEDLARGGRIFAQLTDLMVRPNTRNFYQACRMAAILINTDKPVIVNRILSHLFPDADSMLDDNRAAAFRNVLELLPVSKRGGIFKRVIEGKSLRVTSTPERLANRMAQYNQYLGMDIPKAPAIATAQASFSENSIGAIPLEAQQTRRDNDALTASILANRSIYLSGDGHKLGATDIDSELENYFVETRVTPNKDTRKYPNSLACHVALRDRMGRSTYIRISPENRLFLRVFIDGQAKGEHDLQVVAKGDGTQQKLEEMWYFILRKLEHIFVRNKSNGFKQIELGKAANDGDDEDDGPYRCIPPKDPITPKREEVDHVLDLKEKGSEMATEDLKEQQAEDKQKAQEASEKVKANRKLAVKLLEMLDGEGRLPEKMPTELENLVVYQQVEIAGENYYEAVNTANFYLKLRKGAVALDDYFIRTKRAYSQTLPYVKYEQGDRPYYRVVQKKAQKDKLEMKKTLFGDSGEGHGLDLSTKPKILNFEVDATTENLALFEAMKSRTAAEIEAVISRRINRAVDRNITAARLKYAPVDGAPSEQFLKVQDRMHRLAKVLKEMEVKLETEVLGKLVRLEIEESPADVGEEIKKKVILRLPQVFQFEQTFNQGQFQSLAQLRAKCAKIPA